MSEMQWYFTGVCGNIQALSLINPDTISVFLRLHGTAGDISLAEGVGFEPTNPGGLAVFKTAAIVHSATPPRAHSVPESPCLAEAGRRQG